MLRSDSGGKSLSFLDPGFDVIDEGYLVNRFKATALSVTTRACDAGFNQLLSHDPGPRPQGASLA
jgi:hypothetical protein